MRNQTGNARRLLLGIATVTSLIYGALLGGAKWGVMGYALGGLIGGALAIVMIWVIGILLIGILSLFRGLRSKSRYADDEEIDTTTRNVSLVAPVIVILLTLLGIYANWR